MDSRGGAETRPVVRCVSGLVAGLTRLSDSAAASDPGYAWLGMASTTALTLGVSLGVLYGVTQLAGQPFTVALLGVVISMIASMAFKDPQPRQRLATAAAMLGIAAATVTLGAVLAPYTVAGDIVFVAIMAAATAGRRFGPRATILGMVGFMTYFFALFLGATISMLPWLICALAIGAAVSLGMTFALPQRPARQLRHALHALRARLRLLLAVVSDGLTSGRFDASDHRRLSRRMAQVSQTTLMVDSQLDGLDSSGEFEPLDTDEWTLRLFDLELASEHLAHAWNRAADGGTETRGDPRTRAALGQAIAALDAALRHDAGAENLTRAGDLAQQIRRDATVPPTYRVLALAVDNLSQAAERCPDASTQPDEDAEPAVPPGSPDQPASPTSDSRLDRLAPSSRQAVQVTIASSLAIVAGEMLSSARWYWAVIAAFVIYSGTSSRGETLTKGRQRIAGTVAGVAVGTVVASLVGGNVIASICLIFVSLFAGFYLMQVSYLFMVTGMTTMLALLYGLLGEFTIGLLLTRIEETAIGAVIGIITAMLVLPTSTRDTVGDDMSAFVNDLGGLLRQVGARLAGESDEDLTAQARDLDRQLDALRTSATPLTSGISGLRRRGNVTRVLNTLLACDHYARGLTRVAERAPDDATREAFRRATTRVTDNLDTLAGILDDGRRRPAEPIADLLDRAQTALDDTDLSPRECQRLTASVRYLRQIDLASRALVGALTTDS